MGDVYIKRKDVLIKLEIAYDMARVDQKLPISDLQHEVNLIKAADVQPIRRGRWENEYLDDDVWWADCTNCKNDTHSRFGRVSVYAYCPNCGAKMDAEPDEPWQSE